eukprot:GHVU01099655.1.p1 GENE.GHVU01099655.1~~GHVU01099655.1.p1  ORF type:complete len:1540 (-),score=203.03 GHVU01099655.1:1540-6159(-)
MEEHTALLDTKSIFPALKKDTPLRVFQLQCEAVKLTNTRYSSLQTREEKDTFEATQLLLAASRHQEALVALCDVTEAKNRGAYTADGSSTTDPAKWLKACWDTLKEICEPLEQDARDNLLSEFKDLKRKFESEFSGNVATLASAFKHLKAEAAKFEGVITDQEAARILLDCLPRDIENIIRATLRTEHKDPNKVLSALRDIAEGTGARLGQEYAPQTVRGDVMFVSTMDRVQAPSKQGRGFKGAPPGRREQLAPGTGCDRCGKRSHATGQSCPAANEHCRFCNTRGHFERVCRKKQKEKGSSQQSRPANGGTPTPRGGGLANVANAINVMDARCNPDEVAGWMTVSRNAANPISPVDSLDTSAGVESTWYCDTACTEHVTSRSTVQGCILRSRPKVTEYRMAKRGLFFDTIEEAAVPVQVTTADGKRKTLVLKLNIAADNDIPSLIKPQHLRIESRPERSWATISDFYGNVFRVRVDDPMGSATGSIPSFNWTPIPVGSGPDRCLFARTRSRKQMSSEDVRSWHARLNHPGVQRLHLTLLEQGYEVSEAVVRDVTSACDTCARKNAVTSAIPSSQTRRDRRGSFNDKVLWDLGHVRETGYGGEHNFVLMVDEGTRTWRAQALKKKSDAPDALLEWLHEDGTMKTLQSDNGGELKSARIQLICKDNHVYMRPTPAYTSPPQGAVEQSIRELRSMLRVFLNVHNVPFSLWPALLPGLCALHNNTVSPVLKESPAQRRFRFPPKLTRVLGDRMVAKLPASKTAPKTLSMPGTEVLYLGELNSSAALVYNGDAHTGTVLRVHPTQLRPLHGDTAATKLPPPTALPRQAASVSPARIRFSACPPVSSSSEAEDDHHFPQPVDAELGAVPPDDDAHAAADAVAPPSASPVPPLPALLPAPEPVRAQTRSTRVSSPRLGNAPCAIATHWNRIRQPAVIRQDTGGRSVEVSWLRPVGDNQWEYDELERIPRTTFHATFPLTREGKIPAEHLSELENSPARRASSEDATDVTGANPAGLFTFATSPPLHGGGKNWAGPPDFQEAACLEYAAILANDVIGEKVERTPYAMSLGWLFKHKADPETGGVKAKARIYAKGFMDRRQHVTYAGTPALHDYLLLLVFIISMGWKRCHLDAENAFLQAPAPESKPPVIRLDISVPSLPPTSPNERYTTQEWEVILERAERLEHGSCYQVKKALYGHPSAPFWWAVTVRKALLSLGWKEVAESIFTKTLPSGAVCAVLVMHVDDIELSSKAGQLEAEAATIRAVIRCKAAVPVEPEVTSVFLGMRSMGSRGRVELSHDHYLEKFECPEGEKGKKVSSKDLCAPHPTEVDRSLVKAFQAYNGTLGWVVQTRPNDAVLFSLLSKHSLGPSDKLFSVLMRVLFHLQSNPSPLIFKPLESSVFLVAYSDAAFTSKDGGSRIGYKIYVRDSDVPECSDDNIVAWKTQAPKVIIDSSTSAELLALKWVVKQLWRFYFLVVSLWCARPCVIFFIDSEPLHAQLSSGQCKQEPALQPKLDYVLQELKRLNADVVRVPRCLQNADAMTKVTSLTS